MTGLPELDSGLPGLARHLRAEAAEAIARAQAAVAQSRQRRAARKQWQRLWSAYCRRPSTYLTCCAELPAIAHGLGGLGLHPARNQ